MRFALLELKVTLILSQVGLTFAYNLHAGGAGDDLEAPGVVAWHKDSGATGIGPCTCIFLGQRWSLG